MKVKKTDPSMNPGYPTRRQFRSQHKLMGAAALALGALVCGCEADNDPKPLAGVPLQDPKQAKQTERAKEIRLPGDLAVEPVRLRGEMRAVTNAAPVPTNAATASAGSTIAPTNAVIRLMGVMPPPRTPGKPASTK
jgi:hypothetical protein